MKLKRENACMIYDKNTEICIDPSLPVFNLLGKKYTLLILGVIGNNNTRKNFNDILNSVPGISKTILAKRLKELIGLNIILKDENDIITYGLTNKGIKIRKGLIEFLNATL